MPYRLPGAGQDSVRIGEQSAAVETEVYVARISHDVTKAIFERLAGKRKSDRKRVPFREGFDGLWRFLQNNIAQRQRQISDLRMVGGEKAH